MNSRQLRQPKMQSQVQQLRSQVRPQLQLMRMLRLPVRRHKLVIHQLPQQTRPQQRKHCLKLSQPPRSQVQPLMQLVMLWLQLNQLKVKRLQQRHKRVMRRLMQVHTPKPVTKRLQQRMLPERQGQMRRPQATKLSKLVAMRTMQKLPLQTLPRMQLQRTQQLSRQLIIILLPNQLPQQRRILRQVIQITPPFQRRIVRLNQLQR